MKTSFVTAPRWSCRLVRNVRSVLGESVGGAHVEHCADCQAFLSAGTELDAQLRRSARVQHAALVVPADLDQRILRAVRFEASAPKSHRAPTANSRWSQTLVPFAGILAAAALLVLLTTPSPPDGSNGGMATNVSTYSVAATQPGNEFSWSEMVPPAAVLQANPLQDEVELVYSDAKSALHFLELNFLPAGAVRRSE